MIWMAAATVGSMGLGTATMAVLNLECPLRTLTGWDCPLCGGTRAVIALADGRWTAAAHDNLLVVLSPVVFAVGGVVWWLTRQAWVRLPRFGQPAVVVAVGLVLWTVLRNLPALAWLRPLEGG